jgi:hypothetical protein
VAFQNRDRARELGRRGGQAKAASNAQEPRQNPVPPSLPPHKGRHGGRLQTGGTNPGGGRPSNEFRAAMAKLAEDAACGAFIRKCLAGKLGYKAFFAALSYCSERAWGKPSQALDGQDAEPTNCKIIVEYE